MPELGELSQARFYNFILWYITKDAEQADVDKFLAQLWKPPKGEEPKGPWSPEAEMEAFKALQASFGALG